MEDVLHIVEQEQPEGVIVQFGGQTPLNIAGELSRAGVPILGTSPENIDRAEDREHFQKLLRKLGILQPANGTAANKKEALRVAERIGYPVVVRPSFVLGGRAMEIVYDRKGLEFYMGEAVQVSPGKPAAPPLASTPPILGQESHQPLVAPEVIIAPQAECFLKTFAI